MAFLGVYPMSSWLASGTANSEPAETCPFPLTHLAMSRENLVIVWPA